MQRWWEAGGGYIQNCSLWQRLSCEFSCNPIRPSWGEPGGPQQEQAPRDLTCPSFSALPIPPQAKPVLSLYWDPPEQRGIIGPAHHPTNHHKASPLATPLSPRPFWRSFWNSERTLPESRAAALTKQEPRTMAALRERNWPSGAKLYNENKLSMLERANCSVLYRPKYSETI